MTDWLVFPGQNIDQRAARAPAPRSVVVWLWIVAAMVFAMVIVGGATRLTESGLSITEWKPITGAIPPLSDAAWQAEFEKYKQIPQYRELFPTMDLAGFKVIFFWEWGHRLLGRLIGLVFALPLAWFWLRGKLPSRLKPQLVGLLALGGLQGAVGWWMVASGLVNRVEVAQERLAIHLLLASLTFAWLVWIAVGLRAENRMHAVSWPQRALGALLILATLVQIGLGGLVAGLRAGLSYNTWPLMDGRLVPPSEHLMKLQPWWANFLDNVTTVQFQHRMAGYLLLALALVNALAAFRAARGSKACRRAMVLLALTLAQLGLGVATLLTHVQIHTALTHQAVAMLVLGMAAANRRLLSGGVKA